MTKLLPVKPIYLAFLLVLVYYALWSNQLYVIGWLLLSLTVLQKRIKRDHLVKLLVILVCFALYITAQKALSANAYQTEPSSIDTLQIIPDTLSVNGDNLSFRGKYKGRTYQAFYRLASKEEQHYFKHLNQTVLLNIKADLQEAEPQRNFDGFDYRAYLKTQSIYRIAQIERIEGVTPVKQLSPTEILQELRRQGIVQIKTLFPAPMRNYMTGLLFGYLDKEFSEMNDIYSSLGIIHLFALSGMQVGFFIGWFRKGLLRLGIRQDYVQLFLPIFSFIYAGLTGFSISVIRSLVQYFLSGCGISKLDNFAITVMVMFVIYPSFLLTTGGVLSFAYAFILAMLDSSHHQLGEIKQLFALNLGVFPLLTWYFSGFQPMAIVLTTLFSLLFDHVLLPLLLLTFIIAPIWKLDFLNGFFVLLENGIKLVSQLVGSALIVGHPNQFILMAILIILGIIYDFYKHRKLRMMLMVGLTALVFLTKNPMTNEVTVVDVGQGDAILIRDMTGKTVLIDVGGRVSFKKEPWQRGYRDSNAEQTLIPYLKSRGISHIDQLVLTHTDSDHVKDMEVVAKKMTVDEVLVSSGSLTVPEFEQRLRRLKVTVRCVKSGDSLPIMGSNLQVLYPVSTGDGGNNDSIVLYGRLLDKTFLFTGDLEKAGEEQLLSVYPDLSVDVLKAGHHGSKGSSSEAFLDHIQPEIALLSVGRHNRYHHPHQETLDRFDDRNINYLRTDQQGAIRFTGWWQWHIETVR